MDTKPKPAAAAVVSDEDMEVTIRCTSGEMSFRSTASKLEVNARGAVEYLKKKAEYDAAVKALDDEQTEQAHSKSPDKARIDQLSAKRAALAVPAFEPVV